jgi:hypothetical protein
MDKGRVRGYFDDPPVYSAVIDDTDISRFLGGLLLRLTAVVLAVALASIDYGGGSMDGVKAVDAINHINETGAE